MMQRIQTLYLLLAAAVSGGLVFVCSLWTEESGRVLFAVNSFSSPSPLVKTIFPSFLASSLLSALAIFLFKNRKLQFLLGRINVLVTFYLLGVLVYVSQTVSGEAAVSEKGIGMFLPIVVIFLLVMANKAIKRDEDLVKSVDRLR